VPGARALLFDRELLLRRWLFLGMLFSSGLEAGDLLQKCQRDVAARAGTLFLDGEGSHSFGGCFVLLGNIEHVLPGKECHKVGVLFD
jgi:hypothetical protein